MVPGDLHIAADNGNEEMISCLLEAGADPNTRDEEDLKPLQVAAAKGNRAAVEIFFPVTSPDPTIPDWTVDGLLAYAQHQTTKAQEVHEGLNEKSKNIEESKADIVEVSPENKQKSLEAKLRGDEAFKNKDYLTVDAYTQVTKLDVLVNLP
jgi:hypothetical protein